MARVTEIAGVSVGLANFHFDSKDRLFDSFFTTKPKGLGLGLSIARTIAEAHRGSIRAENNPSVGATFRVVLPEAQPEPAGTKTTAYTAPLAGSP